MHRLWFLLVLGILTASIFASEPLFQTQNIFPPGGKHAHSASIVECPDGSLLTCWFYGSGERKAADVVVQGSRLVKGSKKWSPVFQLADDPEFPDCNPVLFIDRQERLWMFWVTVLAERWECSQLKYRRAEMASVDGAFENGAPRWSWQDVINLKPGKAFVDVMQKQFDALKVSEEMWAEYAKPYERLLVEAARDPYKRQTGWMTRTHPLTLPSGRILLPVYSDGFNASLMAISDDDGKTWRASSPIIGLGPIQPSVVRKRDGTLVAYCRDSGRAPKRVLISQSKDDGETWSPATDTDIPNPGSSLAVLALQNGDWIYAGNDTEEGRDRLTVMLSKNEGADWSPAKTIEPSDKAGTGFDYPSVMQSRDEAIHLVYSYSSLDGRCIRHCKMNSEWIELPSEK